MTIEQLQYFMAIVKYKNFSIAAEECYISQSSLSKQIKALEHELGDVELFNRNTKKLEITYAGKEFYISADKILMEYQKMMNGMKKYRERNTVVLNIGSIPVLDHYGLTDVLIQFQEYYSNVQLHITETTSALLVEKFMRGRLDIGFFRDNYLPAGNIVTYPLIEDELILIVDAGHPLAKCDEIDLKKAENEKFLFTSGLSESCYKACVNAGFATRFQVLEVRSRTIKTLVANGQGVSLLLLGSMKFMEDSRIKIVHLKTPVMVHIVLAVRNEAITDVISTFIEYVRDSYGKL